MSVREPSDQSPWTAWWDTLRMSGDTQRKVAERLDKWVRSDAFLSQVGKAMEGSLVFKAQMDRWIEQSLRAMRMPTAKDMDLLFERLDALERRLDAIEQAQSKPKPRKKGS